jgi:Tfp pilus assembly protein PilX
VARVRERVLGAAGREAALRQAEQEHQEAEAAEAKTKREAVEAQQDKETVDSELEQERRRRTLLVQLAALPAIREQAQRAEVALRKAEEQLQEATATRQSTGERVSVASTRLATAEAAQVELTKRLEGEREALQRTETEALQYDESIRDLETRVSTELSASGHREGGLESGEE